MGMKDLRRTLEEFEANKASEIRNLESSLTKSLSANKAVNDKFGHEQKLVSSMEQANAELKEQMEKVEKYEEEKKNIAKAERMRKSSVASQEKADKKEWEERMEKLKLQFDKATVESKKNINKLQEENTKANGMIEEIRTDLEKKQVECRTLTNKLNLMEKEFTRYKAQSKEEIERNEKTMEEMEGKISEGRR